MIKHATFRNDIFKGINTLRKIKKIIDIDKNEEHKIGYMNIL